MPGHNNIERYVDDPALGLSCHIYGEAPVQADGRIKGKPFYFRARHAAWTFTVCVSHDDDELPSSIDPPVERAGFFQAFQDDKYRGYFLEGDYGREHEASRMPYDDAERIIRECAQQYLQAAAEDA